MIKAIIFDLDGVIIESEPYHMKAEIEIFAKYGVSMSEDIISEYLGLKIDDFISVIEKRFDKKLDHKQISRELEEKIRHNYEYTIPLVPQVAETLKILSQKYRFALATSREQHLANLVLGRHGLLSYFKSGVYREDVKHGKPHPEVFVAAAGLLGVEPRLCAVVEDAENGFKAANQAGMYVIGRKADYNKTQDFSKTNIIIRDFSQLPNAIAKMT